MNKYLILVVDDENEIADLVCRYLETEGYNADKAYNGSDALKLISENNYDMVITDIIMPGINGLDLVKKIRGKSDTYIILLSAKDSEPDRVIGLKTGADDYVVKPFFMSELIARVQAHFRRYNINSKEENSNLIFEDLSIDIKKVKVMKKGREIELRAKEFELLVFLANHEDQVISKKIIFENVWGENYITDDNTVMVHIRRLRKKIEDTPDNPKIIQTIWGLGYRFKGKKE